MDTLRKLSSMGRSKESKEAAMNAVEQQVPAEQELLIGEENDTVGPSPPRARVTDDDVDDAAGDDDGYDSAVEKIGTSSTPSVAEESQTPKAAAAAPMSFANALRDGKEDTETAKAEDDSGAGNQSESSINDDESSSRNGSSEAEVEGEKTVTRQASIRAMPVAKLTTEEEEDDVDEDDEEEVENEEEYEEANDEVLAEDDEAAGQGDALPRITARETADDHDDEADDVKEAVEEELEQAVSTPLPDQSDDQVEKSLATEESAPTPVEAEEETPEVLKAEDEDNSSNVVEKSSEQEVSSSNAEEESLEEEDSSSNVAEKSLEEDDINSEAVEEVTRGGDDESAASSVEEQEKYLTEVVAAEEPIELSHPTSSLAETEPVDTGVKEEVAPEVAPLNSSKESEEEETEQAAGAPVESISRGASSSLLEELRKLSASRSLNEQPQEAKPEVVAETAAPADEPSQKQEESVTESKFGASNSLLNELKKLSDARLQREASEKISEDPTSTAAVGEQKEEGVSADSGVTEEPRVVDQMVVDVGDGVTEESLDELKRMTLEFHTQGRSASDASKVESALAASSDDSSAVAVTEERSPEVAEVQIMEDTSKPDEVDIAISKEETEQSPKLEKEDQDEGSAAVPSPANLSTADDKSPVVKSQNGNVDESETVQVKSRGFSAADFIVDSDADAEDEDDENDDDDDDDDDEDQDETDMDTAKALAELANAVGKSGNGSESGNKPTMGAAGPSLPSLPQRPAARKSAAATSLDTAGRITQRPAVTPSTQLATTTDESANGETAEGNETREKLQNIRVKFLRLAHRLGQSPQNVVVAQVLYRLGLAESLRGGSASTASRTGAFSFDRANALAEEQEAANQEEELDFACTILVLGKTGVGKSATINSIFDDRKSATSAFKPSTTKVQEIVGTVHGIKVRVIDTPGLLPSQADQQHNERIMGQVKKHIKKASPDIVLYFDRLDMQSRDFGDLPLLRTITDLFGAAVWFNAIVVLTHASSAPPDGPNGVPLSYEMFVLQRSHVVQQTIRQAAGDMRLMNPVSLVENHPACRTNRNGLRVLPNGQIWKPQLLLLCFASKILAEANSLLKLQETATPGRPFGQRSRVPPLPFLLSSLLQSRAQLKLPDEQVGESDESDDEEEEEDSDADDYDELPPFRPLSKEELEELDKEQRQDYLDEIADRERLFQKKQYREEMRRRKEMKKRAAQMSKEELAQPGDEADDEAGKAAAVPVPMPDMALPPSFDSDNPTHRYRYLETANQWLVRPVLETHGWDHDAGYDGFNVEKMFVVKDKIPASISGQVTKDKKEAQVNFEAAASLKHGEGKVTLTGFDIQTIGKDLAYTLRAETRFNNFKRNKTTAGLTCTVLNDTIAAGLKLEDRILIGKRIKMVVNGGVLTGKGDKAFGGSLEATLRGKEYPLSRTLSTLGLSVMDWHGDLAIGGNLQSQFMVGKTMLVGRANLNNRGSGQVSIRASSSEQLQMVLIGIVPILRSLINCRFGFGGQSSQ